MRSALAALKVPSTQWNPPHADIIERAREKAHKHLSARILEVTMRRQSFGIVCLIALALSSTAHAASLNYDLNYNLNYNLNYDLHGAPSGHSGSGEFGVNEVDKLFSKPGRAFDQQILDFLNGNSDSGIKKNNSDSGTQNGGSNSNPFGPNTEIGLLSLNTGNGAATTTLGQNVTNGVLGQPSFAPNPTGQSNSVSAGLSSEIVNSSLGLTVGSTSNKTFAGSKNIMTAIVDNLPLGTGSGFVNSISDSTAPVVSNAPLPAALPLFATGLGGLALLGWLRKRKAHPLKN